VASTRPEPEEPVETTALTMRIRLDSQKTSPIFADGECAEGAMKTKQSCREPWLEESAASPTGARS